MDKVDKYKTLKEIQDNSHEFTAKEFADKTNLTYNPHITSKDSQKWLNEIQLQDGITPRVIRCLGIYAGMRGCYNLDDVERMVGYEFDKNRGLKKERCCILLPFKLGSTELTKEGKISYKYILKADHEGGNWNESFIGVGFNPDQVRIIYKQDVASVTTKDGVRFPTRYSRTQCRNIEDVREAMYNLKKDNITDSNEVIVRTNTIPTCIYVRTTSPLFLLFCNQNSTYRENLWRILSKFNVPILAWED